jgi:hypothetical protein
MLARTQAVALLVVLAGTLFTTGHATSMSDLCSGDFVANPMRITTSTPAESRSPVFTLPEFFTRWERDPKFHAVRTVTISDRDVEPIDLLRPEAFDPTLQDLIARLSVESLSPVRRKRPLAAALSEVRQGNAQNLKWLRMTGRSPRLDSPYARLLLDPESIFAEAFEPFEGGIEVGAWVINYADGTRDISPIFADRHAKAYHEIEVMRPLSRVHRPFKETRSVQLFHTHANWFLLSAADRDIVQEVLGDFPFLREMHVYAIAKRRGESTIIGHYGHRLPSDGYRLHTSTTSRRSRASSKASR